MGGCVISEWAAVKDIEMRSWSRAENSGKDPIFNVRAKIGEPTK